MALTRDDWHEINMATTKLRSMGCAVCVFTPDDAEEAAQEADLDVPAAKVAEWLLDNRKHLEDVMTTHGNHYLTDQIDSITAPA